MDYDRNPATLYEAITDAIPDADALIHGDKVLSWTTLDERASRLAAAFRVAGLGPDSKVSCYLYNCSEYMETVWATLKIRGVPVNVNYRYLRDELAYLLDNSDSEAIVFHTSLGERVAEVLPGLPKIKLAIQVRDDGTVVDAPEFDDVVGAHEPMPRIARSDDDIVMLYTGGTTGMPKGVMYRCGDAYGFAMHVAAAQIGAAVPQTLAEVTELARAIHARGAEPRLLVPCPLMHGTGIASAIGTHLNTGTVITMANRSLDSHELWRTVERHNANRIVIVGDAFARPMADALEEAAAKGEPYDTSKVVEIGSAGTMFSQPIKDRILAHVDCSIWDNLASSEAPGMAGSTIRRGESAGTATFKLGPTAIVVSEDGRKIEPGSGEVGMLAVTGVVPLGYYKDPEKSARTFRYIDGVRYSVPGDYATVDVDGTVTLLGRGSVCINTGGEKVFPEEVEEAVKEVDGVIDCLVVGVPDERFGEAIVAVASVKPGTSVSEAGVRDGVRNRLSAYKVPRRVVLVDEVRRAPNGKADYPWAKETALGALG